MNASDISLTYFIKCENCSDKQQVFTLFCPAKDFEKPDCGIPQGVELHFLRNGENFSYRSFLTTIVVSPMQARCFREKGIQHARIVSTLKDRPDIVLGGMNRVPGEQFDFHLNGFDMWEITLQPKEMFYMDFAILSRRLSPQEIQQKFGNRKT